MPFIVIPACATTPFVPIHLAALSPTLVESELFGHVRGAFTGADNTRQGLLELADGATVFFDEAGDIPPAVQVKLLRVLEQHEVTPVGSTERGARRFASSRPRIAISTQPSPRRRCAAICIFAWRRWRLRMPPLRERAEDIPLLAAHFLHRVQVAGQAAVRFSRAAMDELCRRSWPGNVRRVAARGRAWGTAGAGRAGWRRAFAAGNGRFARAVVHRHAQRRGGAWAREQLAAGKEQGNLYQSFLQQAEPALFDVVLQSTSGNRLAAADVLGIHRATLRKKQHGGGDEA